MMVKISDLVPSASGRNSLGIDGGTNLGSFDITSMSPFNRFIVLSGVFVDPILGQSGIIRFNYQARRFEKSTDGGVVFSDFAGSTGSQSLDDAYDVGNEIRLHPTPVEYNGDSFDINIPVIIQDKSYHANVDCTRPTQADVFYRSVPAKYGISVSGSTDASEDEAIDVISGGSWYDTYSETLIGDHYIYIRGSGIISIHTEDQIKIGNRPAQIWLSVSGHPNVGAPHTASLRTDRAFTIFASEAFNINNYDIFKQSAVSTVLSAISGIYLNANITNIHNRLAVSGNALFPLTSGDMNLGFSNGIGPTLKPFNRVHCISGVFHDPLYGQSGILRYNRANLANGNPTSGTFEYSVDGGRTFEPIITFTQTVWASPTNSANPGATVRAFGNNADNDQRLQVPSGMKCVILACEGGGRIPTTQPAGTYTLKYGIRVFTTNETADQSGTDYHFCSATALRGAIMHAFAEGSISKPLATIPGGSAWLPIYTNDASSAGNTASIAKPIIITYKYIDDPAL